MSNLLSVQMVSLHWHLLLAGTEAVIAMAVNGTFGTGKYMCPHNTTGEKVLECM